MRRISKKLLLVFVCAFFIVTCGCARAVRITRSASAGNFSKYEKLIRVTANKYGLTMNEIKDPNYSDENSVDREYQLSGKDALICIYLENEALNNEETGKETFLVVYEIPGDREFDLDLFTELVNSISGKAVSKNYCADFLSDIHQSKYIPSDTDDPLIRKSKPLDFEPNWVISYTLRDSELDDLPQNLEFEGLTIGSI